MQYGDRESLGLSLKKIYGNTLGSVHAFCEDLKVLSKTL